jgi:hypothetical protein
MARPIPPRRGKRPVWPTLTIVNPGKGLNNVISDEYIKNEESSSLDNIQFVEAGNPAKRPGHTAVGTGLVNNPRGLASFYTNTQRYLLTVDGTSLMYLNATTWTAISGASFTADKTTVFVQAKGDMYIWNGTDPGRKLTSTLTLSAPTTTPSAAFGIFYANRQIVAGTATNRNRLYISNTAELSDFTTDPASGGKTAGVSYPENSTEVPGASTFAGTVGNSEANIIDIAKDDGDKITGLAKFQEKLIIFKERSIWSMIFDTTGAPTVTQMSGSVGCVSHRSIDNVENDIFFLSRNGYYTLGNEQNYVGTIIRTNELSARIHPVIETITPINLPNTVSIFTGYVFYSSVSIGGTGTNNVTLIYDRRYGAWSTWSGVSANAFTEFIDSNNARHLYYAADDTNQVYEIDTGYTDDGQAISAQWTSKAINFGDISRQHLVMYIDFEFRQIIGTVTIDIFSDGNTLQKTTSVGSGNDITGTVGMDMWGDPIWGGNASTTSATITTTGSSNVPYRLPVGITTRTLKFRISNNKINETFVFLGAKIYYRPYAPEKFPSAQKLV